MEHGDRSGFNVGGLRLPLVEADAETAAFLDKLLAGYEIDLPTTVTAGALPSQPRLLKILVELELVALGNHHASRPSLQTRSSDYPFPRLPR